MYTVRIVDALTRLDLIEGLMRDNWSETGIDIDFKLDIDMYIALSKSEMFFAIAAEDSARNVVGYCTVIMSSHIHSADTVIAANDSLYLIPELRSGTIGGRIIMLAEREARDRGANYFSWHCPYGGALSTMLSKRGYTPVETVLMGEL